MGFVRLTSGKISVLGIPTRQALQKNLVAYVPQSEEVDWSFPVLVEDVVMMGRYGHMGMLRIAKILFFTLLSVSTVAALQTVGAFLVICLVVTPGATAWLLTDRFPRLLMIAVTIGSVTSFLGAWVSYFLDGATGGIIVVAQTLLFLLAFVFAPTHGLLANRRRAHKALEDRS